MVSVIQFYKLFTMCLLVRRAYVYSTGSDDLAASCLSRNVLISVVLP